MASLGETVAALARRRAASASASSGRSAQRLRRTEAFGLDRGELRMLSYAPDDLAAGAGLVVVLHGCTQSAEAYAEGAGWLELADRYGFAVLCPEQERANNPNLCFNWFQPEDCQRGQGEAASIREMIARAIADHGLDPDRVFITGLSAGGAMANVMLATYPEVFAAGAIIAGLPYGAASNVMEAFGAMSGSARHTPQEWGAKVRGASPHRGAWPRVSVWQGDQDTTVKPVVAQAVVAQWADVHQAEEGASGSAAAGPRSVRTWRSASGEPVVELHRISGMGHGAPLSCTGEEEACGAAGAFLLDVGVASSLELARSWGLAGQRATRAAQPQPQPRPQAPSSPPRREPAPGAGGGARVDVGEVITKALRSAGLMK